MRILFLTHRIPYPPNKGDKIRSYNILKYLVKRHDVCLASLLDEKADALFIGEIQSLVEEFVFDFIRPGWKKLGSFSSLMKAKPISVSYFYSRKLQKDIDDLIELCNFDIAFCYSSPMAEYLFRSEQRNSKLGRAVRVMDFIDADSYKWAQYSEKTSGWKKWVYRYESTHLARYEKKIAKEFDHLMVVSEKERQILLKTVAADNLSVLSNGVDLTFFAPGHSKRPLSKTPSIVFTGVMDYWPNVEGVTWFAEQVLPKIRIHASEANFHIVGSKPVSQVRQLERLEGVRVRGFVEDIRDYLTAADVCVVPLRIARGIQNKVLEAMAMGKPVVCTSQALDGIKAIPGREVLQADDEEEFAAAVIELIKKRKKADLLGTNARRCMERHYSWEKNLGVLDEIFRGGRSIAEQSVSFRQRSAAVDRRHDTDTKDTASSF